VCAFTSEKRFFYLENTWVKNVAVAELGHLICNALYLILSH